MSKRIRNQRGNALIETAFTIPIVLLVCVGIFEFGRAYQVQQVLTNAAREGARIAVITGNTDQQVRDAVSNYLTNGRITNPGSANVVIDRNEAMGANTASRVTISYPFSFIVLNPVAKLVVKTSTTGQGVLTMQSIAVMRNEI
jgi:Flp pilus assembly protein TadG